MAIDITMPALSPTMETGTLTRWLVKAGDSVKSGDVIAEIETDKATMEVEAVDEGTITEIVVPEGTEDVKVNAVIARLAGEDEDATPASPASERQAKAEAAAKEQPKPEPAKQQAAPKEETRTAEPAKPSPALRQGSGQRIAASPLARRIAAQKGIDLATLKGSGPHGRIVRADVDSAGEAPKAGQAPAAPAPAASTAPATSSAPASKPQAAVPPTDVPHEEIKLSNMRKTIARRLTESKQTVPHYYLTVDIRLDALLKLRGELNASLEAEGVKLSVNDLLVKALGVALTQVPDANVSFAGDVMRKFQRADVSVAVAIPNGLITPVVRDAANKRLSTIATEMKDLAARAKDGKLQPAEYQGGTASLSNLGMYGIKQFEAVINPPEGLIIAVGAGEKRPYVVDDALQIATVMSATGSFDHRAIDGAVGAQLMAAFKRLIENPMAMLA